MSVRRPTRWESQVRRASLAAAVLAIACGGQDGSGPELGTEATELVALDGDGQAWYYDNPLPLPYIVAAVDAQGRPVPGVPITWEVISGGGTVDPALTATDSRGNASATHTLGVAGTSHRVSAGATGLAAVEFGSTATSPPASAAVSVGNNFFSQKDVVLQLGGSVTWTWIDPGEAHNIIYASGPAPRPPDSPTQSSGTHVSTFTSIGKYQYFCNIHAGMEGSVTVVK